MLYNGRDQIKIRFNNITIDAALRRIIKEVRQELADAFDVEKGTYAKYTGLCDAAAKMVSDKIRRTFNNEPFPDGEVVVKLIHGELAHKPSIWSKDWPLQHTITYAQFGNVGAYIDCTAEQFQSYNSNIPSCYLSGIAPWYFYPDRNNPAWNWPLKILNRIPVLVYSSGRWHKDHLVEAVQYEFWGRISDMLKRHDWY